MNPHKINKKFSLEMFLKTPTAQADWRLIAGPMKRPTDEQLTSYFMTHLTACPGSIRHLIPYLIYQYRIRCGEINDSPEKVNEFAASVVESIKKDKLLKYAIHESKVS